MHVKICIKGFVATRQLPPLQCSISNEIIFDLYNCAELTYRPDIIMLKSHGLGLIITVW